MSLLHPLYLSSEQLCSQNSNNNAPEVKTQLHVTALLETKLVLFRHKLNFDSTSDRMGILSCLTTFFHSTTVEYAEYRDEKSGQLTKLADKTSREKGLCLCSKQISRLLPTISMFDNLETIQLCCNNLQEIPAELCKLKYLTSLSLSNNKIKKLPAELGNMKYLTELHVSDNLLESIPTSIIKLQELKILSLDGNRLREIPQHLGYVTSLTYLDLSKNQIQFLPIEISRLQLLKKILLVDCPLWSRQDIDLRMGQHEIIQDDSLCEKDSSGRQVESKKHSKILPLQDIAAIAFAKTALATNKSWNEAKEEFNFPPLNQALMDELYECSTCHGPLFKNHIKRVRFVPKGEYLVPYVYRLCKNHWKTEDERIKGMFQLGQPKSAIKQSFLLPQ